MREEKTMIDCTLVSVAQKKAELAARENKARRCSATKRNRKDNLNEVVSGLIWGTFMICLLYVGIFM